MDVQKVGAFIAQCRKAKNLTQNELAVKLFITDRAVSKWERGKGLPDVSLMHPLCALLEISLSELLNGEKIAEPEKTQKAEQKIMDLLRERQQSKKKIGLSFAVMAAGLLTLFGSVLIAAYAPAFETWARVLTAVSGLVILSICVVVAVILQVDTGCYECMNCHERFYPTPGEFMKGLQTPTRRRLKCPHCGRITWCKFRLNK